MGFPWWLSGKESACNVEDPGLTPGLGSSQGGHGNPLQDSCPENSTDRGACRATSHGVAQSGTRLRWRSSGKGTAERNRGHSHRCSTITTGLLRTSITRKTGAPPPLGCKPIPSLWYPPFCSLSLNMMSLSTRSEWHHTVQKTF